jgi:hypothetical protein
MDKEKIKKAVRMIIEEIDTDPDRPDLASTPQRVANMCEEIFSGTFQKPEDALQVMLTEQHDELYSEEPTHHRIEQARQGGGGILETSSGPGAAYRFDRGPHHVEA